MKALTHFMFSVGTSLYLATLFPPVSAGATLLILWLSLSINMVLDSFGHGSGPRSLPKRLPRTHSIFTAPAWGLLIGLGSVLVLADIGGAIVTMSEALFWAVVGAWISAGHLLLDSFTGAGIYRSRSRFAIAHFRYDNRVLNLAFVLVGVLLVIISLGR
jgi:hypothetical protein